VVALDAAIYLVLNFRTDCIVEIYSCYILVYHTAGMLNEEKHQPWREVQEKKPSNIEASTFFPISLMGSDSDSDKGKEGSHKSSKSSDKGGSDKGESDKEPPKQESDKAPAAEEPKKEDKKEDAKPAEAKSSCCLLL
jgi:hypothetical protein